MRYYSTSILLVLLLNIASQAQIEKGSCRYIKQKAVQFSTPEKSMLSENSRSDTLDILKYTINLDITDFSNQLIKGFCQVDFESKLNNVTHLDLDLLDLTIDSITQNNQALSYTYTNELVHIALQDTLYMGDPASVLVYYHGTPTVDASGFGGFDFAGNIAYNLGVAFESIPHAFGRSWFPCFDNFVERSSYEFIIKTANGRKAFCNGYLANETALGGDTVIRHWIANEEITSYMACVAVSNYVVASDTFTSIGGFDVPVALVAHANDTTPMKNSFANLESCFADFESKFGAYSWNKVGYVLTPVGAMEHPTLVAYPDFIANGNLTYESIMAHELAHMWFGNLITCQRAEEMWINEGLAEYLSYLFEETHYGNDVYNEIVRNNHLTVLWKAHFLDGGFYALNGVPQNVTYGEHSYNKGADVMHSLRGYLGDSVFFNAWQQVLDSNKFKTLSSEAIESEFNEIPGVNVSDFFEDWIYQPGFSTFVIDSFHVTPNGNLFDVELFIQQKLYAANYFYQNVPLTITFRDEDWNVFNVEINGSDQYTIVTTQSPFSPVIASVNESEKLGLATTAQNGIYTTSGINTLSHAKFRLEIQSLSDSAFVRVEHNWVAPDDEVLSPVYATISSERYWNITGLLPDTFLATGRIDFDGRINVNGNLDNDLLLGIGMNNLTEDSIVLLYRPNASFAWTEHPSYEINTQGNNENKWGRIEFENLELGQYAIGIKDMALGINDLNSIKPMIFPNPANELIHFENNHSDPFTIRIFSMAGELVYSGNSVNNPTVSTLNFSDGIYLIKLSNDRVIHSQKLIVHH